jgi:hypothetical protein
MEGDIPKPFVLWPLQLIRDRVNVCYLNVSSWIGLIRHFRILLPRQYHLLIKRHPRSGPKGELGITDLVRELPNTSFVGKDISLPSLLRGASAVAGANSTVLYEARLIYHKPVYTYAWGWFTNHAELFFPIQNAGRGALTSFECVEDSRLLRGERLDAYTDWFLAQLLARQITREAAQDVSKLREHIFRLSHQTYLKYGEEIFL